MATPEIEGPIGGEATTDDLEGLFEPGHGRREIESVGHGVLRFPGADPEDRRSLGEVGEGEKRLGDEHRVAPDRLGDADGEAEPPHPASQVPEQRLVVVELMG